MKEKTSVLEHLNFYNKIICELLSVDMKIDEEDKTLILLSSLSESYDHIVTTMLYSKKLSSWRKSHQLSYLMRLEKKIKSRGTNMIGFGGHGKKRKKRRKKRFGLVKGMPLLS